MIDTKSMKMFIKIALFTIMDQVRAKSFYFFMAISIGFLFLTRGCYSSDYVINGQQLEGIWYVTRVIFQAIIMGMLLMVSMISMRIFTKDQSDGSLVMFLSRPVKRWEYVLGRLSGTWLLASAMMLVLHLTLFTIIWSHTGIANFGYITGSIVCSINLLFMIAAVCLFSLFMPDFMAALLAIGLLCTGFVSDGGHRLFSSDFAAAVAPTVAETSPALWRVLFPKLFMVQAYADSLISQNDFMIMGPVHPLINTIGYTVILICLTLFAFNRKSF